MKSSNKVERFDYSKYESKDPWNHDVLQNYEFWGFHPKHGRLRIDTKRYKKACEKVGINDFLPSELFQPRNTVYFVPLKVKKYDYKINLIRDNIHSLQEDWEREFKPILGRITSPDDVEEKSRMSRLSMMGSAEDYDDICLESKMDGFRRIVGYERALNLFICMFLQKIVTEIDRFTLNFMVECGYKGTDFSFENFLKFSDNLYGSQSINVFKSLKEYDSYTLIHKINNFLKHNSRESYKSLYYLYPKNVKSLKNKTANIEYKNGMYAGDWIILEKDYIDNLFSKLIVFFEDYCKMYLHEDISNSRWNYDEYFYNAKKEMEYPEHYLGLDGF